MSETLYVLLTLLPGGLWCAWWLLCVDWNKVWPILAKGGWAGVVLFMLLVSLAWASIFPRPCDCLGFVTLPNFWWQLGSVALLTLIAFFCGWVQPRIGISPAEVSFEPPAQEHGHHGHHGHH